MRWDVAKEADGERTHLKLTHTGVSSFPQDDKAFHRDSCEGGWTYFLGRLEKYLAEGKAS